MNNTEAALTTNFFTHAKDGWQHTGLFLELLMRRGVVFEHCSYSDTRCECDILFTFEGAEYVLIGGCSTLSFRSVDKTLDRWWSMRPNPPNIETIVYRMITRMRGRQVDYSCILPGEPMVWYRINEGRHQWQALLSDKTMRVCARCGQLEKLAKGCKG